MSCSNQSSSKSGTLTVTAIAQVSDEVRHLTKVTDQVMSEIQASKEKATHNAKRIVARFQAEIASCRTKTDFDTTVSGCSDIAFSSHAVLAFCGSVETLIKISKSTERDVQSQLHLEKNYSQVNDAPLVEWSKLQSIAVSHQREVNDAEKQSEMIADIALSIKKTACGSLRATLESSSKSSTICGMTYNQVLAEFDKVSGECWIEFKRRSFSQQTTRLLELKQSLQRVFDLMLQVHINKQDQEQHHSETSSTSVSSFGVAMLGISKWRAPDFEYDC